jgi:RNA polymerase subunit RPABC4/transcription elongation factor Spt4
VAFIPFGGILVHMVLRPRQTLAERYERTLEEEYLRRDVEEKYVCPGCQRPAEHDFILCPYCHTALRRNCQHCARVIDLTWSICPYCGHDGHSIVVEYMPSQSESQDRDRERERLVQMDR